MGLLLKFEGRGNITGWLLADPQSNRKWKWKGKSWKGDGIGEGEPLL